MHRIKNVFLGIYHLYKENCTWKRDIHEKAYKMYGKSKVMFMIYTKVYTCPFSNYLKDTYHM